jgi:hypothetical protein
MLSLVLLATTLWVCPGDVYSNEPREGCRPFQESTKEGFSVVPEAPQEPAEKSQAPASPSTSVTIYEEKAAAPTAPRKECELYEEWLTLSTRTRNSMGALDLTPSEFERWTMLKNMFNFAAPPLCTPPPNK